MLALLGRKGEEGYERREEEVPTLEVKAGRYHARWTNKTNCIPPQAMSRADNHSLEGSRMGWDRIGELGFRRLGELGTRLGQVEPGSARFSKLAKGGKEGSGGVGACQDRPAEVCIRV